MHHGFGCLEDLERHLPASRRRRLHKACMCRRINCSFRPAQAGIASPKHTANSYSLGDDNLVCVDPVKIMKTMGLDHYLQHFFSRVLAF